MMMNNAHALRNLWTLYYVIGNDVRNNSRRLEYYAFWYDAVESVDAPCRSICVM